MFCSNCGSNLQGEYRFCVFCGNATGLSVDQEGPTEDDVIRDYFNKRFTYEEIRMFLESKHRVIEIC